MEYIKISARPTVHLQHQSKLSDRTQIKCPRYRKIKKFPHTSYWCRSLSGRSAKKWFAFTIHLWPVRPFPGLNGNLMPLVETGSGPAAWGEGGPWSIAGLRTGVRAKLPNCSTTFRLGPEPPRAGGPGIARTSCTGGTLDCLGYVGAGALACGRCTDGTIRGWVGLEGCSYGAGLGTCACW